MACSSWRGKINSISEGSVFLVRHNCQPDFGAGIDVDHRLGNRSSACAWASGRMGAE
jgi:hypothetical protein